MPPRPNPDACTGCSANTEETARNLCTHAEWDMQSGEQHLRNDSYA